MASGYGSVLSDALGADLRHLLSIARTIDLDADSMHDQSIEDRRGERGVSEVASPVAQFDVRGDGGRAMGMPAVDEVVEGMGRRGLVIALLELSQADIVDDEEACARTS